MSNTATSRVTAFALVAVAPPAIVVGVVRGLRERGSASVQAIMGVLCIYLLMGMLWAFVYGSLDRLGGDPFFANGVTATASRCLYFSFTTLTTVGYGDLTARSNLGHTLAVTEALIGPDLPCHRRRPARLGPGAQAGPHPVRTMPPARRVRSVGPAVNTVERLLCRLSLHDERSVRSALADPGLSALDPKTQALVGLGAAARPWMPRPSPCGSWSSWPTAREPARKRSWACCLRSLRWWATRRTVAVAPRLALALGYDVEDPEP